MSPTATERLGTFPLSCSYSAARFSMSGVVWDDAALAAGKTFHRAAERLIEPDVTKWRRRTPARFDTLDIVARR